MKKVLLFFLISLVSVSAFSQVTVSINNLANGNTGASISSIAIPSGGSLRITFTVRMTKPSNQAVSNGYLDIYTKRASSDPEISVATQVFVPSSSWFGGNPVEFSSSYDITLQASNYNASGGQFFARFSDGFVTYNSSNKSITVIAPPTPPISNNSITANQTIVSGTAAATLTGSTPTGGNGAYTYAWQRSVSGGAYATISGATAKNYSPGVLTATTAYKRIVSSTGVTNSTSNIITVTVVSPPITNNVISSNQTIDQGTAPSAIIGTTPSGGNGSYTYQWQKKDYNSSSWSNIAGSTAKDYSPGTMLGTTSFRRIVNSGTASPNTSTEITVTILVYPEIWKNSIAFNGVSTVTGSVPTGGNEEYLYNYYCVETEIGAEYNSGFTTNKDFVVPTPWLNISGTYPVYITRTVKSLNKTSVSQAIRIQVDVSDIANNTLTFDGVSFVTGSTPTGGPGGGYTYSWQVQDYDNLGSNGIPMNGATGKDLSVPLGFTQANELSMYVRRIVSSGTKISYSEWTSVNVPPASTPDIGNNIIAFDGTSFVTGSTPTGGYDGYEYRWELSESATSIPSMIMGFWQKDLSVPLNLTIDTNRDPYVRRVIYSGYKISYSNWVSVLVGGTGGRRSSSNSTEEVSEQVKNSDLSSTDLITVYPNPTQGKVNFGIEKPENVTIVVYREGVKSHTIFSGYADTKTVIQWELPNGFLKGLYFYKVIGEKGVLKTGKLIYQ